MHHHIKLVFNSGNVQTKAIAGSHCNPIYNVFSNYLTIFLSGQTILHPSSVYKGSISPHSLSNTHYLGFGVLFFTVVTSWVWGSVLWFLCAVLPFSMCPCLLSNADHLFKCIISFQRCLCKAFAHFFSLVIWALVVELYDWIWAHFVSRKYTQDQEETGNHSDILTIQYLQTLIS